MFTFFIIGRDTAENESLYSFLNSFDLHFLVGKREEFLKNFIVFSF